MSFASSAGAQTGSPSERGWRANGADTVFDFGNGQTLTLQNVTLGNLNAGDFPVRVSGS
jgi:hypothetical protein